MSVGLRDKKMAEMSAHLLGVRPVAHLVEKLVGGKVVSMAGQLVVSTADQSVLRKVAS